MLPIGGEQIEQTLMDGGPVWENGKKLAKVAPT